MDELQKRIFYYLALNGLKTYLNYPDYTKEEKIKALEKLATEAFEDTENLDNLDKEIFNLYYGLSKEGHSTIDLIKKLKLSEANISKRKMRADKVIINYYLLDILKIKTNEKLKKRPGRFQKYRMYKGIVTQLKKDGYSWEYICEKLKINFRTAKRAFDYKRPL